MGKITLEKVLSIQQLNFHIDATTAFIWANTDGIGEKIYDEIEELWDSLELPEETMSKESRMEIINKFSSSGLEGGEKLIDSEYNILRKYESNILPDRLLLILAKCAVTNLMNVAIGKEPWFLHKKAWGIFQNRELMTPENLSKLKSLFAEGIIIANSWLKEDRGKGKPLVIEKSIRFASGTKTVNTSSEELSQNAKSELVLRNLDYSKLGEYLDKKWLKKHEILKAMRDGIIPIQMTIDIMAQGVIKQEEILKEVFKVKSLEELLNSDKLSMIDRLQLYSAGLIGVEDLEKYLEAHPETKMPTKESYKQIAKYYKGNIRKLSELLTHNVLDYNSSIEFLEYLSKNKEITPEEKEQTVKLMTDFKVAELLNTTQNGDVLKINCGSVAHRGGLTLDPKVRLDYLKSIGGVKQIFIRGSALIDDNEDSVNNSQESNSKRSKKNSLDGYQLIIIPEKGVAVLEKFYEVTRNAEGKLEYRKNEKGELIPAIENATYIMPIGMAKDFVESKNKQELIKNPYVTRAAHTRNWVSLVERGIEKVCRAVGTPVSFEKENTDLWSQKVKENYDKLLESR